ncbi:MAG: alkaline phosphatase family protein [Planctomycetota bacterium]|nr:MAG: alkaline phosphatase family protein [Planctomycetota bacterium]
MRLFPACRAFAATVVCLCALSGARADDQTLSRIAFGSCAKQDEPQPIWDAVVATEPDVFLFIGDNIYGDSEDMQVLKQKWNLLGAQPGYQKLKETCPILATWDDHDYGANDAGLEYPKKHESQQIFLDFFDEPAESPRRKTEGVYDAEHFGPEGERVQIILLDTRYFRSPLTRRDWRPEPGEGDKGPYDRNIEPAATILGEQQWAWLEEKLREPAEVRIIASSIQVIPDGHHWEKWGNFPLERQRLFELIRRTEADGVIFISGDRHSAEISAFDPGVGYELIDVTSSSLNRPSEWHTEPNPHRRGTKYTGENFGLITIDWREPDPTVRCQVRDIAGKVVLQHRVKRSSLVAD